MTIQSKNSSVHTRATEALVHSFVQGSANLYRDCRTVELDLCDVLHAARSMNKPADHSPNAEEIREKDTTLSRAGHSFRRGCYCGGAASAPRGMAGRPHGGNRLKIGGAADAQAGDGRGMLSPRLVDPPTATSVTGGRHAGRCHDGAGQTPSGQGQCLRRARQRGRQQGWGDALPPTTPARWQRRQGRCWHWRQQRARQRRSRPRRWLRSWWRSWRGRQPWPAARPRRWTCRRNPVRGPPTQRHQSALRSRGGRHGLAARHESLPEEGPLHARQSTKGAEECGSEGTGGGRSGGAEGWRGEGGGGMR